MKNKHKIIALILMVSFLTTFILNSNETEVLATKHLKKNVALPEIVNYFDSERIIIIGDSRMYGASQIIKDEDIIFIAKNGATCSYLKTAEEKVDKILEENPNEHFSIFLNLGVNDLIRLARGIEADGEEICDAEDYTNYYLKLKEKWSNHNLFFNSVNPIDEEFAKKREKEYGSNSEIKKFNDYIYENTSKDNIYYCDTYKNLMNNGFDTEDSLHYTDETTKHIISNIQECDLYKKNEKISYIEPIMKQLHAIHADAILENFGIKLKIFGY